MSAARTTLALALTCFGVSSLAAQATKPKPEDTEVWTPVPRVVTPAKECAKPPSDAIVLFDGKDLAAWRSGNGEAKWKIDGDAVVCVPKSGDITTTHPYAGRCPTACSR